MTDRTGHPDPATARKWRDLLASERDAAALYDRIAATEKGERATILRELADVERRHARHWEERMRQAGLDVPAPGGPGLRARLLGATARYGSSRAVLRMIERTEHSDAGVYDHDPDAAPGMAADERGHATTISVLLGGGDSVQDRVARREGWHRGDRSGAVRAGIFGVSDGLVSNTALMMGFAGSGASRHAVLLAGVAGLLAGAFSMAAGEYVSMSGQREMYERELELEAAELDATPEEEREELILLYRAKGLDVEQATQIADRIMADREVALDTLAREELGLDPDELGSPWRAASASLLSFAAGAVLVVLPYLITGGRGAFAAAAVTAGIGMFGVGAGIGLLNGRPMLRSGTRQLVVGGLAAAVTFGVGYLIGGSGG